MHTLLEQREQDTCCEVRKPISSKAPAMLGKASKTTWPAAENVSPNVPQTGAKLWFQKLVQTTLAPKLVENHYVQNQLCGCQAS